jgi:predicted transcriptional regulator of viral defense system
VPGDVTIEVLAMTAGEELHRLRGVFIEVPGTHVTSDQAARLAGIDPDRCAALLNALVDVGFLRQLSDGRYRRAE